MKDLHGQCNYVFIRTALLWVITQREVVISYRSFGTTCRYHLQGLIKTALFWVVTQRVVVIRNQRFGSHYSLRNNPEQRSSNEHVVTMAMQIFHCFFQCQDSFDYHYPLRNNPEERRPHLLGGGSLKSRTCSPGTELGVRGA